MARKPRIHYEGALYYVICRGNNRDWIFSEDNDKEMYIELIKNYRKKYGFRCYAFCVMGNHVHMLIEVSQVPLSKIMQGIQQVYTQYYNRTHNRIGHVFSQRYKAILCNKDAYLLMLIRYIHQNPLRAGVDDGIDYRWSSHEFYLQERNNDFLDTDFPLKIFDERSKKDAVQKYLNFVYEEDEVVSTIRVSEFSEGTKENDSSTKSRILNKSLEELLTLVASYSEITVTDLISKRRHQNIAQAKKVFIWICSEHTPFKQIEIANVLGVTQASVSKVLKNKSEKISEIIEELIAICGVGGM